MKVLVTGANGFLGRHVVESLRHHGHSVRALVRPATRIEGLGWDDAIEVVRADLCGGGDLDEVVDGVEAVVHLAARMDGSDFERFQETVVGTERLFEAMQAADVRHLVLCSSFAVYDWRAARGRVDETLRVADDPWAAGGYSAAKIWQERLAERRARDDGWSVSVLRPGFIWGPGNAWPDGSTGRSAGSWHLVFGGLRRVPLTHVVNCADAFRRTLENPAAIGETLNVVDDDEVSAWRFAGEALDRGAKPGRRVFVPYWLLKGLVVLANGVGRLLWGPRATMPGLLVPARFAQATKPVGYSTERLRRVLGSERPLPLEAALEQSFGPRQIPARSG